MTTERPLIAHVIHRLDVGGMENGLVNLINRMPAERYRHAVVSLTDATEFRERIVRDDVPVLILSKRSGQDLGLHVRLFRLFRKLAPALVHTRNLATVEAVAAAALARVPCRVHGEHGRDVSDLDGRRLKYRLLRRALSPLVHRFIALSRDLEKYLLEGVGVRPAKVSRIVNGVDLEKFHSGSDARGPSPVVIGCVTRMQEVKDPLTLARAFVRLVRRGSPVRLVFVGDGPLLGDVRRILEDGNAMRHASLVGRSDDVPALLRAMDVFALSSRVEGISNTILEAMATGLPVVATRVGGNEELVEDGVTGTLVASRDPEALEGALARYVSSARLRREHGRAARLRAEKEFGLDEMVERYVAVYDSVLAARNVAAYPALEEKASLRCAE
jgi:sugar transferase (PEP-CTERM/EpsH1 system associated)